MLQETIKRVLREHTKLSLFILRRVKLDDLNKEFGESLDEASNMYFRRPQTTLDEFTYVTISMMMDGIHWDLHSKTPDHLQWYDDVFNNLKHHYGHLIEKTYKSLSED